MPLSLFLFCFKLILVLNLVDAEEPPTNTNVTIANLVFTCDVRCKRNGLDSLPSYCRTLATSNNSYEYIEEVQPLRTKSMKFMRTISDIPYKKWLGFMKDDAKIREVTDSIEKFKIDAIAFDYMYKESNDPPNPEISDKITEFQDKIKKKAPNVLFGLWLPKKNYDKAFVLETILKCVDFFVVNSYEYKNCKNGYFKKKRTTTEDNLKKTIQDLKNAKYPIEKVLLLIDIRAHTKKSFDTTTMTYTEVCSDKKSQYRVFCVDFPEFFYEKAFLVFLNKMLGLYVLYADYDDWRETCNCEDENKSKTFPMLKMLEKGRLGEPKEGPLFQCEIRIMR